MFATTKLQNQEQMMLKYNFRLGIWKFKSLMKIETKHLKVGRLEKKKRRCDLELEKDWKIKEPLKK